MGELAGAPCSGTYLYSECVSLTSVQRAFESDRIVELASGILSISLPIVSDYDVIFDYFLLIQRH